MKNKLNITALLLIIILLLAACGPTTTTTPGTSPTIGTGEVLDPKPSGKEYTYINNKLVQQPDVRDYTTMWWRDGFNRGGKWQMNMQTGYYGLTVNTVTGVLQNFGAIKEEYTETQAGQGDNQLLESLPNISTSYELLDADGNAYMNVGTAAVGGGAIASRILETGRYMQRIDILSLKFKDHANLNGRVELAVMPEYLALEFSMHSPDADTENMGLKFWFTLPSSYTNITQSCNGRAITAADSQGNGLTFILPDLEGVSSQIDGNDIIFQQTGITFKKNTFTGFGVVVIPSTNASAQDAVNYLTREALESSAVQITPKEGRAQDVTFDTTKGYLSIDMNKMMTSGTTDFNNQALLDDYDRLTFTITNNSAADIKLPIQFVKDRKFGVEGMCPILRDAETGEPIGVQVQLSKNWHNYTTNPDNNYAAINDPKRAWSGTWFHGYTMLEIPAGKSITYEMCITYATWGGVYACSHSQISLAGWGGNYQQWETSAIGCFGESFCYDPETAHGRAFIDDIRPLAVISMGGKYGWTGCNGGGNMLMYTTHKGAGITYYKQVETRFKKQGPNLTEVIYTGITLDGAVRFEITANLPRTDDVSRAWHSFKYTFLKDVSYDRMVFYQFGADDYNDNQWDTMAVGNDEGTASFTIGDTTYNGQFTTPLSSTAGYVGNNGMQRIDIDGDGLWFAFTDCVVLGHKQGPDANRMLNVVSYNASINGQSYNKPSFNLRYTTNYNIPCLLVELCPPAAAGDTIKAGSTVEGVVEYLNLPVHKEQYYGPSSVLANIDASEFNTWKLAYRYAIGNKTTTTANVGTVTKQCPIYVACKQDADTVAEITVKGGMSFVPLTFTNLPTFAGYELQINDNGTWKKVDQSVHGNDYWQSWYDSDTKTYELTYNVEHSGNPTATYSYRLVKSN